MAKKILLVEDNADSRDMLVRRLQRRGYDVIGAVDGAEGVEMALKEIPDVILMDIDLPVIDGYEATRRIKANPQTAHIPVIGLSANAMAGDSLRAIEAGCADYETKPIELPSLLEKLGRYLPE